MRHFIMMGMLCGCLLIGSFYPQMILGHHLRLIDENGKEIMKQDDMNPEIPLEIQFRFLEFFR